MSKRMNVVLITVDSLRADHVGCYGGNGAASLTPNLDALAARSLVFTRAFAQGPYTTVSLPALFTGQYPCRLKPMGHTLRLGEAAGVSVEGAFTLPQRLREEGYQTAGFHSNPLVSRLFGFHTGFDVFFDDILFSDSSLPSRWRLWMARLQRVVRVDPYLPAGALNAKVLEWLREAREPFFLWIHYMDPHGPYLARKVLKYISKGERVWRKSVTAPQEVSLAERELLKQNYRRQIVRLDAELGQLWEVFDREGLFDRSLLVLAADHGDEFCEHGGYSHSHKLYDELLRVPLLVRSPQADPGRVDHLTELIQIAPTVLEHVGLDSTTGNAFDAESFLPPLDKRTTGTHKTFVLAEAGYPPHKVLGVRTEEWKLIWRKRENKKELYHLPSDPGEQTNLTADCPQVVSQLGTILLEHQAGQLPYSVREESRRADAPQPTEEEHLVIERLRDLGYL